MAKSKEKEKGRINGLGGLKVPVEVPSLIISIIVILVFVLFLLIFAFMAISFFRWIKTPAYYERVPTIKPEEYACPKCSSKELELVGRRTLRCRKCGTTFTIRTGATEVYWIFWPFLWFLPIIWPVSVKD